MNQWRWIVAAVCFSALAVATASAQEFRGSILGRITDPSGAVVPGAAVTVTNEETNVAVEVRTNQEGNYNVPYLLPGRYRVSVASPGFRTTEQRGVIVQINDRIELNLTLEVGATAESVVI